MKMPIQSIAVTHISARLTIGKADGREYSNWEEAIESDPRN